jgi:hypothetical protein
MKRQQHKQQGHLNIGRYQFWLEVGEMYWTSRRSW